MCLRRAVLFLAGVAASSSATAAPTCEPLGEGDFIALVLSAQSAADRDNQDTLGGLLDEIRARVPCLGFAPAPRLLADYFVLEAVHAFGERDDWQTPLDAALRIHPMVYRGVGPTHPISSHQLTPEESMSRPVPRDAQLYVDGRLSDTVPGAGAMHLVQVTNNGLWRSTISGDQAVDDAWILDPIRLPLELVPWGRVGIGLGTGGVLQRRGDSWPASAGQNDFIPDETWVVAWPSVSGYGGLDYGRVGVRGEIDIGLAAFRQPVGSHVQGAVVFHFGSVAVGGGGGLGGSVWVGGADGTAGEGVYERTVEPLSYGHLTVARRAERSDGALSVGVGPAVTRGAARYALLRSSGTEELPMSIGLIADAQQARLLQDTGDTVRPVSTVTWHGGLELGLGR